MSIFNTYLNILANILKVWASAMDVILQGEEDLLS